MIEKLTNFRNSENINTTNYSITKIRKERTKQFEGPVMADCEKAKCRVTSLDLYNVNDTQINSHRRLQSVLPEFCTVCSEHRSTVNFWTVCDHESQSHAVFTRVKGH